MTAVQPPLTLQALPHLLQCKPRDLPPLPITMVTEDSRRVKPGAVFVAARGEKLDGHDFAARAIAAGAIAVIGSRADVTECNGAPYLATASPRRALGMLAHALAGNPTHAMTIVGVTGTNGKTTTCKMVQSILGAADRSCAFFGTIGYEIGGTRVPATHTTPFGEELADLFVRARDAGHTHVAMEVSSHALDQERVAGIRFRVAAFTNLTQDHLDYHKDMEAYKRAKLRLFEQITDQDQFAVINRDDPAGTEFQRASRVRCLTYGELGDCAAADIRIDATRTRFQFISPWGTASVAMRLLGRHNVSNALCAAAIAGGLGVPVEVIVAGLHELGRVPGRFESLEEGQPFRVIVDYAHTEDGLRNVLKAARGICEGRLVVVFGCGGDRDKGKRPKMGAAAAELADFSIVTSDNPRTEDPERILLDIEVGLQHAGRRKYQDYLIILDRAQAIRSAIEHAKPGDVVLIAGKGHEDYQILGDRRIHFDDCEVAREALRGV